MAGENVSHKYRTKEIDKIRYYFIEEIKQNELISKKHKNVYRILNHTEHLLVLASVVTGCVLISVLASLVEIPVFIASSAIKNKNFCNNCRN